LDQGGHFPLERALVRIWRDGVPVGAGFLVGPAHLFTAAHVVADVIGVAPDGPAPGHARLLVDFPLIAPDRLFPAELAVWVPEGIDPPGDIAGLRLLETPPATARPLVLSTRRPTGDQVVMLGFPRGLPFGSWLHGRLGGTVATGWREILSEPTHGAAVERGFSGTPVWSSSSDTAVGMVVRSIRGAPPKSVT
jgi:S1-C subfamily serine protease